MRAGDDCVAVYSMQGPTRNVLVRNLTCYTPLSVTHGHDTSNVTFDGCTVYGNWGHDATGVRPRWFKTATRVKTDRKTNGTLSDITYRNIRGVDVDLMADITSWYPCHNGALPASCWPRQRTVCRHPVRPPGGGGSPGAASPPSPSQRPPPRRHLTSDSVYDNYLECRKFYPVVPGVTSHIKNVLYENLVGENAWRAAWLNCLPETPCTGVRFRNFSAPGALGFACENVHGDADHSTPPATPCFSSSL